MGELKFGGECGWRSGGYLSGLERVQPACTDPLACRDVGTHDVAANGYLHAKTRGRACVTSRSEAQRAEMRVEERATSTLRNFVFDYPNSRHRFTHCHSAVPSFSPQDWGL
jgi:hypothetical protein